MSVRPLFGHGFCTVPEQPYFTKGRDLLPPIAGFNAKGRCPQPTNQVGRGAGKLSPPSGVAKVADKHRSTVTTDLADVLLPSEVSLGVFLVPLTRVVASKVHRQDDTTNRLAGQTEK